MSFAQFSSSLPPSLSLKNRTGVVTGAASGIGRQVALHLARLGCAVLCADLNPLPREDVEGIRETQDGKLKTAEGVATHELINQLGGLAEFYQTDVSNEDQFKGAVEAALKLSEKGGERPGRLDYLINNAGINAFIPGGIMNEPLSSFEKQMAVNVRGTFIGSQLAVKQMMKQSPRAFPCDLELDLDEISFESLKDGGEQVPLRKSYKEDVETPATSGRLKEGDEGFEGDVGARGSRGVIVNIGSIHGLIGGPGEPAYAASKGAVVNLSRQVACDYAPYRINCNSINPGYLNTAMTLNVPPALSLQRPTLWPHRGVGKDVALLVVSLVRDSPFMTGSTLTLDGGTTAR